MNIAERVTIVIPSLNPDEKLRETVEDLLAHGFTHILLVNDGSKEECVPFFPTDISACTLLTHEINRGKGAAMKTAFRYILENKTDTAGVVTVDGDGQHRAEDVLACARSMTETQSVVLGVRDFSLPDVPPKSRMGNRITSLVFRLFCGIRISDTQTGLRAIPTEYLPQMLYVEGDRYEYETNMLLQLEAWHIPYSETSIQTVYLEDNRRSHFRPFHDSVRIYALIFKFISSSLIASVVDLSVFALLTFFFTNFFHMASDMVFTCIARVVSSLLNYYLNRKTVFKSNASPKASLIRYYILAIGIMIASGASVSLFSYLLNWNGTDFAGLKTLLKFTVDSVLFFISFRVQREWVFTDKNNIQRGKKIDG